MRPIRLTIEGINSFIEPQTLDFEAAGRSDLFCICGKTGAGKTTIFDSIMFALYGRSGKGDLADIVNLSCKSAKVSFEFDCSGTRYYVERTITCRNERGENGEPTGKRKGFGNCTLYKNGEPLCKGDEATKTIEDAVGLGESEFKTVYLLEQGEYAEFLKKTPAKQLEAVGKIFELMRFGDVYRLANERQKQADIEVNNVERLMSELGEDVSVENHKKLKKDLASIKGSLAAAGAESEKLKAEIAELEKTRDVYRAVLQKKQAVADGEARLADAKEKLSSAETAIMAFEKEPAPDFSAVIDKLNADLNELSVFAAKDASCDAAIVEEKQKREEAAKKAELAAREERSVKTLEADRAEKKERLDGTISAVIAAAAKVKSPSETLCRGISLLKDRGGSAIESVYYELSAEKSEYDGLVKNKRAAESSLEAENKKLGEELDKIERYAKETEAQKAECENAAKTEAQAEKALSEARLGSHAAAIASELHKGDKCPVCGGVFDGEARAHGKVDECKATYDGAKAARTAAERRLGELEKHLYNAKTEYEHTAKAAEEKKAELNAVLKNIENTRVDESYDGIIAALASAKRDFDAYSRAETAYAEKAPVIARTAAERKAAEEAADEASNKAATLIKELGEMRGKTSAAIADKKAEIRKVTADKAERDLKKQKLLSERDASFAAKNTLETLLEKARADCPADIPEFDEDGFESKRKTLEEKTKAVAEFGAAAAAAESKLELMEKQLEKLKGLKAERALAVKKSDIYAEMARVTKAKSMLNFVATEYIEEFTSIASERLRILSAGKYSLEYDRESGFMISDYLNDGKRRPTGTLSGGEMFLASLSVAIAIASAKGGSSDNGFFFLDEGFGTLDDELIDTVYAALEELAKSCLVGVISHSAALIERMPARVEVIEATDTAGSVIKN